MHSPPCKADPQHMRLSEPTYHRTGLLHSYAKPSRGSAAPLERGMKICLHIYPTDTPSPTVFSISPKRTAPSFQISDSNSPIQSPLPTRSPQVQNMAPRAPTPPAQRAETQAPALAKFELPADQAKYVVHKPEMEEFLTKTFGAGLDFNVSVRQTDPFPPTDFTA